MSETIAAAQLRAFIERVERLEEEIKELNADKSDIYKEMRGVGFDVKTVRKIVAKRKLETHEREEQDELLKLYWDALYGSGEEAPRVHVHEGRTKSPIGAALPAGVPSAAVSASDEITAKPEAAGVASASGEIPSSPPTSSPAAKPEAGLVTAASEEPEAGPPPLVSGSPINDRCRLIKPGCQFRNHPQKITCASCTAAFAKARKEAAA